MSLQPHVVPREARPHRLFHDRTDGVNYLSCLVHGEQTGAVTQERAEAGHAAGEPCPTCVQNIAATGSRRTTNRPNKD